jgi:hypothetical protein
MVISKCCRRYLCKMFKFFEKVPPVNSDVLVHLKNITVGLTILNLLSLSFILMLILKNRPIRTLFYWIQCSDWLFSTCTKIIQVSSHTKIFNQRLQKLLHTPYSIQESHRYIRTNLVAMSTVVNTSICNSLKH